MCGIVGLANNDPDDIEGVTGIITDLINLDSMRGYDSTGVGVVWNAEKNQINSRVLKEPVPGFEFTGTRAFRKIMEEPRYSCIIGHNRAATKGTVKKENAHPFVHSGEHGEIMLVHNGTLFNKYALTPVGVDFDVDSECLAWSFAHNGVEATIEKTDGSYSLVWWDKSDHSINFLRNTQRPMEILLDDTKRRMYFASEKRMLEYVLFKNGMKIHPKTWNIDEDYWYKFSLDDLTTPIHRKHLKKKFVPFIGGKNNPYSPDKGHWISGEFVPIERLSKRERKRLNYDDNSVTRKGYNIWNRLHKTHVYFEVLTVDHSAKDGNDHVIEGKMLIEPLCQICVYLRDLKGWTSKIDGIQEGDIMSGKVDFWKRDDFNKEEIFLGVKDIEFRRRPIQQATKALPPIKTNDKGEVEGYVLGPAGIAITVDDYNKLTKHGCAFCSTNILESDARSISWTPDNRPVCLTCHDQLGTLGEVHH